MSQESKEIFEDFPEQFIVVTDPNHFLYDPRAEEPAAEELVESICVHGVIQPIIVTENLEVIAGRRRVKAAIEANKRHVQQGFEPVPIKFVVSTADQNEILGMYVTENELREDDTILQKAAKATKLKKAGMTEHEIALNFGVSYQTICSYLALDNLDEAVRYQVEMGNITVTAAAQLAELPSDEQVRLLDELMDSGGKVTVERAKQAVKEGNTGSAIKLRPRTEVMVKYDTLEEWDEYKKGSQPVKEAIKKVLEWVLRLDPESKAEEAAKEAAKAEKDRAKAEREARKAAKEEEKRLKQEAREKLKQAKLLKEQTKASAKKAAQ